MSTENPKPECDCKRWLRPLDSGEPHPNHICPEVARATCAAWVRDTCYFPDDDFFISKDEKALFRQEGRVLRVEEDVSRYVPQFIPLPDGRFAYVEGNSVRARTSAIKIYGPKSAYGLQSSTGGNVQPLATGQLLMVLRQWVEVPVSPDNEQGRRYAEALFSALPRSMQDLAVERLDYDAKFAFDRDDHPGLQLVDQNMDAAISHYRRGVEAFRRKLLEAGLPATPGNAHFAYYHTWHRTEHTTQARIDQGWRDSPLVARLSNESIKEVSKSHPRLHRLLNDSRMANFPGTMTRGALVTSYAIRQNRDYSGNQDGQYLDSFITAPGIIFGIGLPTQDCKIHDACLKVMTNHREFCSEQASNRTFTYNTRGNFHLEDDLDRDLLLLYENQLLDDVALAKRVNDLRTKYTKDEWEKALEDRKIEDRELSKLPIVQQNCKKQPDIPTLKRQCRQRVKNRFDRAIDRIKKEIGDR